MYVFPLPQKAAIREFVMTIGSRRIRGIVKERSEAERIYKEARAQGYVASLMTQERPNIFTQKVANIEPGHRIDVAIRYFHTLSYHDGAYSFVFPMVVGPRFNPPGHAKGIGAIAHRSSGRSNQSTNVSYLRPKQRSGHDVAVTVDVNMGVTVDGIRSRTHDIVLEPRGEGRARVELARKDRIPNRDLVLEIVPRRGEMQSALVTQDGNGSGGYFTLMLHPPGHSPETQPLELVFVVDASGSMKGAPIRQAKDALRHALRALRPDDSFQLIRFSNTASPFGRAPVVANRRNVKRGLDWVDDLDADGGTMMLEGVKTSLDFPHDPERLRFVCFLTDGYIGNEGEVLTAIHEKLGDSRIFSFGVGSSPNRYLMERMARVGRGAVAWLGLEDDGDDVMRLFLERVRRRALRDIELDFGATRVSDVFPKCIPDLFEGRPVAITGRYQGRAPSEVRLTGRWGRDGVITQLRPRSIRLSTRRQALGSIWARMKIADLNDRRVTGHDHRGELTNAIRRTALRHGLLSPFTGFVAVDSSRRTDGSYGVTVPVPTNVPAGTRYDTTVGPSRGH